ncbi:Integral membrane protein TerC [Enhygromyxa salina]|uniref:Integral membrane protein TerC n=2 Tax=Enhygromyxa salina TaxID=215803 RepID=A0A0C2CS22_9BACT|nr:Integral membrane protein TerC [Enhygromyxa salina]
MLALDLGVFHRDTHRVSSREALIWSVVWVTLSLCFCGFVWWYFDSQHALEWLSAYVIEKSLSVDNIFVFIVIFRYMKIPREHLHRVLFAGILGALVLRAVFILVGLGLIEMFTWSLYLFGGFLIYTGLKLLVSGDDEPDDTAGDSWVKRKAEQWLRVTREYEGPKFFVNKDGKWFVTTLFVCLLMVETADVIFALDSIPAIFGISRDPFIVFTSNVCAILGLRAMFFLLENVIDRFRFLPYGLGLVLAFIGVKMVLAEGIGGMGLYALGVAHQTWLDPYEVPIGLSLGLVAVVLVASVLASLLIPAPAATSGNDE